MPKQARTVTNYRAYTSEMHKDLDVIEKFGNHRQRQKIKSMFADVLEMANRIKNKRNLGENNG